MASTRDVIAPPIFAEDASTTIPPTPIAGQSYRDPVAGPASSPDGWPYAQLVNSAEFNQLMFQWSSLLSIMDLKGVLGWSSLKDYTESAIAFGSDGKIYTWLQESGPGTAAGVKDPISEPLYWSEFGIPESVNTQRIGVSASATGLNATVSISATNIPLVNGSNEQISISGVSESCNLLTSGAGGLDTGTISGNTWYYVYVIYNPTTLDVSSVASLSMSAPTLPAGYTHYAFIEAVRTNGGATLLSPMRAANGICYYNPTAGTPVPSDFPIAVGTGSATTLTAVSIAALVPPSAKSAIMGLNCSGPSTGNAQIRMSSAAASGLLALSVATGQPTAPRLWLEFPDPQTFTPHYSVAGSGLATILVMGWRS